MQSIVIFLLLLCWLGLVWSDQLATVPGVGGGAGEVGGVGLPESTGGQARIDWLALPATAQQRGELEPFSSQVNVW